MKIYKVQSNLLEDGDLKFFVSLKEAKEKYEEIGEDDGYASVEELVFEKLDTKTFVEVANQLFNVKSATSVWPK